jgi:uncharacterized coiled-coil protein SlyX
MGLPSDMSARQNVEIRQLNQLIVAQKELLANQKQELAALHAEIENLRTSKKEPQIITRPQNQVITLRAA